MMTNKKTMNVLCQTTFMFFTANNDHKYCKILTSFNQTTCKKQKCNDEIQFTKNNFSCVCYN